MSSRPTFWLFSFAAIILGSSLSAAAYAEAKAELAPVAGYSQSFLMGTRLANGTVTVLETGEKFRTGRRGHFGPINYPVGKPITLQFEKWGYKTTQSATIVVPRDGLTDPYHNVTFQIPSVESYYLLAKIVGATIAENSCHVTATITAFHKTMEDVPQGEEGAVVTLTPAISQQAFYFDIYQSGPLKGKTNPFTHGLTQTSEDGGVAFFNLPPRDEPYVMSAIKAGVKFSKVSFLCKKDGFVNLSPPIGPMVIRDETAA